MFLLQFIFAQAWELTMTAQDVATEGSSDYIRIGSCEGCHDGFHFGEDEYDLPDGGSAFTDIQLFNFNWLGDQDDNGVTCNNPNFYVDKRSLHGPEFLSEWRISGITSGLPQNTQVQLSWSIDNLINDIDIFFVWALPLLDEIAICLGVELRSLTEIVMLFVWALQLLNEITMFLL